MVTNWTPLSCITFIFEMQTTCLIARFSFIGVLVLGYLSSAHTQCIGLFIYQMTHGNREP